MSSVAHLRIVHITDVYTLANFPSLKTMLGEMRASVGGAGGGGRCVSVLTGDFLAPYLLSSFDKVRMMMIMMMMITVMIMMMTRAWGWCGC